MRVVHCLGSRSAATVLGALLLQLGACKGPEDAADFGGEISHRMSDQIPTVATVTWAIDRDDAIHSWVEFGEDGAFDLATPVVEGSEGEHLLLGMHGNASMTYRIAAAFDAGTLYSDVFDLETGSGPPTELPSLQVDRVAPEDTLGGFVLMSFLRGDVAYPVVVDSNGEFVWWWERPDSTWDTANVPRAYLSRDGGSIIYMVMSELIGSDGLIVKVSLDGVEEYAHTVTDAHHDFVELPDGSVAVLVEMPRTIDGEFVKGDAILNINPDGSQTTIWNGWEEVEYDPDLHPDQGTGWTHANALDYDEAEDCFYLGLRNLNSVHKLSRTGETLWRFGGASSDWALADGSTDLFDRQHQFEVLDDRIVVFSNNSPDLAYSDVVEYTLPQGGGTTELVWNYRHDPDFYTLAFGAAERIDDDNTLVTWTTAGLAEVVDPMGTPIWSMQAGLGAGMSYMHWTPDLYTFPE